MHVKKKASLMASSRVVVSGDGAGIKSTANGSRAGAGNRQQPREQLETRSRQQTIAMETAEQAGTGRTDISTLPLALEL